MDHSDLLQFHFFNQNEIRIELIAERAAALKIGIVERSIHDRKSVCSRGHSPTWEWLPAMTQLSICLFRWALAPATSSQACRWAAWARETKITF
jgi:hypothetical protein